jgi:hypothetical protein
MSHILDSAGFFDALRQPGVPVELCCIDDRRNFLGYWAVGSRTGAVFRRSGLSVAPRFLWECLNSQTVNPFPAPATSHPACGLRLNSLSSSGC